MNLNKKSGTRTIAVPLIEALVLPLHRTSNTEAHADMYEYTPPYEVTCTWIYISRGHQYAALSWCFKKEFTRFQLAKPKRIYDALYINMSRKQPHPQRHPSPSLKRGLIHGTKLQK